MRQETLPPLLTITHRSPDAPAVTCAALSEDGVRLMSGVAAGRCVGAPPAALGSGLVTVVATQLQSPRCPESPVFTPNMSDGVPARCSAVGDTLGYSAESPLARVSATPFIPSCSHLVTLFAAAPYKSKLMLYSH